MMHVLNRWFILVGVGFIIAIGFNNCSPSFYSPREGDSMSDLSSLSNGACEDQLKAVYAKTYFPFLTSTCNTCHVSGGRGLGVFATDEINTSFATFMSVGPTKINARMIDSSHQPPFTGPQNQVKQDEIKPQWAAAEQNYITCQMQASLNSDAGGGNSGGSGINTSIAATTVAKSMPTGIISKAFADTNWKKISWDTEVEVSPADQGKYAMLFSIEVRAYVSGGAVQGYEFRNPMLRLKSASSAMKTVRGVDIYVNGLLRSDITTYLNAEGNITSVSDLNLAPLSANAFAYKPDAKDSDSVAIAFKSITPYSGSPTRVTYTQLASAGGVFNNSCIGCHGAVNPRAGLNLTNFAQAQAKANTILSRMKNTSNPMPTGGILPQSQIDMVQNWINSGTPQ